MGLKFFDLFAGIGGFRLGMERAGHECVGSCEWDKYARETYKKNFGSYPEYNDAKNMSLTTQPYFDVLCAGFPCQAFSIAGKRLGFEDTRGTIFFEIARVAKEKRPRYLFLENVRGLLSHDKGRTFRTILNTLDEMGYDAEWQVLNSKYFVPQNRERIFIIGHLRGERTGKIFPLGEYDEKTNNNIKRIGGNSQGFAIYDSKGLAPTISACTHGYAIGNIIEPQLEQVGNIDTKGHNSLWGRVYDPNGIAANLNANGGGLGAKTGLYRIDNNAQRTMICKPVLTPDREEKRQRGRRFKEDGDPAFTLTAQDRHGIYDGIKIRKLTPVECERLQGFPDNWTQGVSDTQRYKQCGNAVTVNVVEYIAKELRIG